MSRYEPLSDIDLEEDPARDEPLPLLIRVERRPPLPLGIRVTIFLLGWLLILIGVAGLVLPGIQGIVTIVAGAALLSLDNQTAYRCLRKVFKRWPGLWRRIEHFREKAHDRIHRLLHPKKRA